MDRLFSITAIGKLNRESELPVLLCKWVLVGFSSVFCAVICFSYYLIAQSLQSSLFFLFFFLFLHPGQIQEVSLGQEEAAPQVEVTPELDLEVVPESSGDWHNVFP